MARASKLREPRTFEDAVPLDIFSGVPHCVPRFRTKDLHTNIFWIQGLSNVESLRHYVIALQIQSWRLWHSREHGANHSHSPSPSEYHQDLPQAIQVKICKQKCIERSGKGYKVRREQHWLCPLTKFQARSKVAGQTGENAKRLISKPCQN